MQGAGCVGLVCALLISTKKKKRHPWWFSQWLLCTTVQGLVWRDLTLHEAEVAPLQRLLVDVPLSGGAWLHVPPAATDAAGAAAAAAAASPSQLQQQGGGSQAAGSGWRNVPESERISSCDIEAIAPWQAVCCLTPDATQLADAAWSPFGTAGSSAPAAAQPEAVRQAAESARRGDIPPLRVLAVDVLAATADGRDRWAQACWGEQCFEG
jgi:DNA polymerase delta subunit 1